MSEQTPNSSEDLSGAEPSMEDILASIRKIISEDEPVAMESPEDAAVEPLIDDSLNLSHPQPDNFASGNLMSDASLDREDSFTDAAEGDSVDLNIDDVLARLDADMAALGAPETVVSKATVSQIVETENLTTSSDLNADDFNLDELGFDSDEDILSLLDDDIPLVTDTEVVATPEISGRDDAEMNALLEDILSSPDEGLLPVSDAVTAQQTDTTLADLDELVSDLTLDASADADLPVARANMDSVRVESGEDLDLVKSLMADLSDDPDAFSADNFSADDDLDALLAIPEVEDINVEVPVAEVVGDTAEVEAESAAEEEEILGDILDMTLEDELLAQPDDIDLTQDVTSQFSSEDVAALEVENAEANETLDMDDMLGTLDLTTDVDAATGDEALPSLTDIAAAAEADAMAAETIEIDSATSTAFDPLSAIAGVTAVGGGLAALHIDDQEADVTPETAVVTATTELPTTAPIVETSTPIETPTPTEKMSSQETSMPVHAVKTDAILDEVTESAAAGAFAELSSVVEDKAIFNERGPRIGDLVQEALRPMLKEWLDANLKGIVERAVAKEVKRISTGK